MVLTPERATELARLSHARREQGKARFPRLRSPGDALRRLELMMNGVLRSCAEGADGKLIVTPQVGNTYERLQREWRETYFAQLDLKKLRAAEQELRELREAREAAEAKAQRPTMGRYTRGGF